MEVEMRQTIQYADPQHTAMFGICLGCRKLELRAVELHGNLGGFATQRIKPIGSGYPSATALEEATTCPAWSAERFIDHCKAPCAFCYVLSIQNVSWRQTS